MFTWALGDDCVADTIGLAEESSGFGVD